LNEFKDGCTRLDLRHLFRRLEGGGVFSRSVFSSRPVKSACAYAAHSCEHTLHIAEYGTCLDLTHATCVMRMATCLWLTLLKMMQPMERVAYRQRRWRERLIDRGFKDGDTAVHLVANHLEYYMHAEVSM
jgi:hypothetical protein